MNTIKKLLACGAFAMTVFLVAGISGGETVTAPLNGCVSFTGDSAAQDTLKANAGAKTIKATSAVKVQGHANSEITVVSTPATGIVTVATVTLREGESLYNVLGVYVAGGGGAPGAGESLIWDTDYNRGPPRLIIHVGTLHEGDEYVTVVMGGDVTVVLVAVEPSEQAFPIKVFDKPGDDGVAKFEGGSTEETDTLGWTDGKWKDFCVFDATATVSTLGNTVLRVQNPTTGAWDDAAMKDEIDTVVCDVRLVSPLADTQTPWKALTNIPMNALVPTAMGGTSPVAAVKQIGAKLYVKGPAGTYKLNTKYGYGAIGGAVTICAKQSTVTLQGSGSGIVGYSTLFAITGAEQSLTAADAADIPVMWRVMIGYTSASGSQATKGSVKVYNLVLALTDVEFTPNSQGGGVVDEDNHRVRQTSTGNLPRIPGQADLRMHRYASFISAPTGVYGGDVKARITILQFFVDTNAYGYGVSVLDDSLRTFMASLNMSLSYGVVSWTPPNSNNCAAAFASQVGIKGPIDTGWNATTPVQISVVSSDIPTLGEKQDYSVETSATASTPTNRFKVGDASSRAEAYARISASGAVARENGSDVLISESYGGLKPTGIVPVTVKEGTLELTPDEE